MVTEEVLDQVASAITRRGLTTPAVLLLEMHRPLMGCMRELCTMVEPLARVIFGPFWTPVLKEFLSSPENVERLIARLERREESGAAA